MLKKFYFKNFKGFEKAEMTVENLTTVIGTNASGKSNAVEGIKILSELMTGRELSTILDGSKNMESEIRGGSKGCCRFDSSFFQLGCLVQYDETHDLEYKVKIAVSDRILIDSESLYEITDGQPDHRRMLFRTEETPKESGDIKVIYDSGIKGHDLDFSCIRSSAVISQIPTKLPQNTPCAEQVVDYSLSVMEQMKRILFLNPDPAAMRGYSKISDTNLKVNASNLSSVLNKLCKDKKNKSILLDTLRQLPENEIADITFADGLLSDVILFLLEVYGSRKEKIDAFRLSDGTLRCLAIMAALLSEQEQGMIVIEEVDNGIHPGRAKMIIQKISELAELRKIDVIITTHNAVMLNALSKKDLMGVVVIYRDSKTGASTFVPLVEIENMAQLLAAGKLGDVMINGLLLDYIKKPDKEVDYSWLGV